MKATDLMIGDWVAYSYKDKTGIAQVTEIQESTVSKDFLISLKETPLYIYEEHLVPIPLTPEILEKNGYKEMDYKRTLGNAAPDYRMYYDVKMLDEIVSEYDISCRIFPNGEVVVLISTNNRCSYGNVIRFVHQLQHALRLCGIEKEIEL